MSPTQPQLPSTPVDSLPIAPPSICEIASLPKDAVDLGRKGIGPQIFHLTESDTILKVGKLKLSEAEAMRFVASRTSIPVPHVHDAYEKDGLGYIFMSKVDSHLLSEVWKHLTVEKRDHVTNQLRRHMQQLREIRGDFYGTLWRLPSEDTFFKHFAAVTTEEIQYGPFYSRRGYNEGLVQALRNSRPRGVLSDSDRALAEELLALDDEDKVFCHGDLHRRNILVDDDANVTGIIDWAAAGFSITGQDYFVCKSGARDADWTEAVDAIFSDGDKVHYNLWAKFDQELTVYTGM